MKKIVLFLYLIVFIGQINAQYLVIDNSSSGGIFIPFQDTIIEPPYNGDTFYYLDLDQDSITDIKFWLKDLTGGMGTSAIISMSTYGNFVVFIDTTYQEHYQYLKEGVGVIDTVRTVNVVNKYTYGDTIWDNHISTSEEKYILNHSRGNFPSCVYNNITLFNDDTSFIAVRKQTNNVSYLYYIKVLIQNSPQLNLMYAKSNDTHFGIGDKEVSTNTIYPNPTTDQIFFKTEFESVQIFNYLGYLILENHSSIPSKTLNIAQLPCGIYVIHIKSKDKEFRTKLIKL